MQKIDVDIAALRQELCNAPVRQRKMSVRQLVFELMPELRQRRNAGDTLEDLVCWFAGRGISIKLGTLCKYMKDYEQISGTRNGNTSSGTRLSAPRTPVATRPLGGTGRTEGFVELRSDL